MSELFWLSEARRRCVGPLLPSDTPGTPRLDDRRMSSGIVHVLRSGCRWRHAAGQRLANDTIQPLRSLGDQGGGAAHLRGARHRWWPAR